MTVTKLDLRPRPTPSTAALGQFSNAPAREVLGLHPFQVGVEDGDTLPTPDTDTLTGDQLTVGTTDAVYYLTHPAPVSLGSPPIQPGAYAGQRLRLSARSASLTIPADPAYRGGPIIVRPGTDLELVWDPAGQWAGVGIPVGGIVRDPAVSGGNLVTSTPPGAGPPADPPYPGAQLWFSYGSALDPIILSPGSYLSTLSFWVEVSANNTAWWLDVRVNGLPSELVPGGVGPGSAPLGSAGAQAPLTSILYLDIASTFPVWLDVYVARESGTGSVTFKNGVQFIQRIS